MAKKSPPKSGLGTLVGISVDKHQHAQKITHRSGSGQFKPPPAPSIASSKAQQPAELDQDADGGFNANGDFIQE